VRSIPKIQSLQHYPKKTSGKKSSTGIGTKITEAVSKATNATTSAVGGAVKSLVNTVTPSTGKGSRKSKR